MLAGLTGFVLILLFWTSSVVVEMFGSAESLRARHQWANEPNLAGPIRSDSCLRLRSGARLRGSRKGHEELLVIGQQDAPTIIPGRPTC